MTTRLVLMRHGQTAHNSEGRFQGRLDAPLDDYGVNQAEATAEALKAGMLGLSLDAMYSSPLARAAKTAQIVGGRLGMEAKYLPELMEIDVGDISDLTVDEAVRRYPGVMDRFSADWWYNRYPGGQSHHLYEKENVLPAIRKIYDEQQGKTVLVVTHGGFIRTALLLFLALGDPKPFLRHRMDNCGLTTFALDGIDESGMPQGRLLEMNLVLARSEKAVMDVYSKEDVAR
ncbi:MAG TPA: histidine phosphatase family protein [Bacillota bacterium]|nr:histidine phosphatase family protein [Bacillota bacterium]